MADVTDLIRSRIEAAEPTRVWTPVDLLDLGSRDAVDKALQRLARAGTLRRIDRGLYDRPNISSLTKRPGSADYRKVLDALARRDQVRMLVDGLTAANDLGLTTAVPARVVVHTDARRRSIPLGNLTIEFKRTAPSKLYWAGRPAMRLVQA
jgi:predicted transcriptional regulator of viral defense system